MATRITALSLESSRYSGFWWRWFLNLDLIYGRVSHKVKKDANPALSLCRPPREGTLAKGEIKRRQI
jgi:hypothetical protein